jgi:hypothetical protein
VAIQRLGGELDQRGAQGLGRGAAGLAVVPFKRNSVYIYLFIFVGVVFVRPQSSHTANKTHSAANPNTTGAAAEGTTTTTTTLNHGG